ncbi:hypothetical protein BDV96DRAFT_646874 [Lophiotrema nucula]|uniref:BTB domain-containing protein n=1 Tax=Lophiotrema nucula TaxID=690887 RepID=A0A6A5Z6B8_9PLEO|nr:hypothetical protein BDV96DRAFT_646874 [Lophiotrema nucula]
MKGQASEQIFERPAKMSYTNFLSMSFDMVNIRVGDPAVDIPVYKDLICSAAPYFNGAFNKRFKEANERSITLDEVSERTFRAFLHWAYIQSQPTSSTNIDFSLVDHAHLSLPDDNNDTGTSRLAFDEYRARPWVNKEVFSHLNDSWLANFGDVVRQFLYLYIFADKYCVDQLRDDAITALCGVSVASNWWLDPVVDIIYKAYEKLPRSNAFDRFLLESFAYIWSPQEWTESQLDTLKDLHPQFLADWGLLQTMRLDKKYPNETLPKKSRESLINSCKFHEHKALDESQCRERLAKNAHIFLGLLEACKRKDRSQ